MQLGATMKPTWAWAVAHFLSPPYTLYPQTGAFLKVWCLPSPLKKRHPGIRGLSPGIAFCREIPAKSYWGRKGSWFVGSKLEIIVDFYKIQKSSSFPKKQYESPTTTKMNYAVSHCFKNGTPTKKHTTSRLFPGKQERLHPDPSTHAPSLENQME